MRHKNHSHMQLFLNLFQQLQNLCLNCHIQCCRRFICDQNLRIRSQCNRQHTPLSHSTGKLVWKPLTSLLYMIDSHQFQQFCHSAPDFFPAQCPVMHADSLSDLPADTDRRIQCTHRILKYHRKHASPQFLHFLLRICRNVFPVDGNTPILNPSIFWKQFHDTFAQYTFPTTGFSDNCQNFSAFQGKTDVPDCFHFSFFCRKTH